MKTKRLFVSKYVKDLYELFGREYMYFSNNNITLFQTIVHMHNEKIVIYNVK